MLKRMLAALLVAMLILGAVVCATAEGPARPAIRTATYANEGDRHTVALEYDDPKMRDWIEVYALKKGEEEPNMGVLEIDGEKYAIVGIQTINPTDPNMYKVLDGGATSLNTELYFGDHPLPEAGEELFLTVGLTDQDGEEALGELIPIAVPQAGEAFTNASVAIQEAAGK